MTTMNVSFPSPAEVDLTEAGSRFNLTASRYTNVSALVRKYYLFGNGVGGEIYLCKSRTEAEAMCMPEWTALVGGIYGADPLVEYFETPVIVDDVTREIETSTA